jgi:transposase InsO family protein
VLASRWISPLLALEIPLRWRPAAKIHSELRALIWRMSVDNRLWGAPHIHGELLKLGFAVAQSTVAKYMAKKGDPSGQSWGTFLHNHAPHIAAMDLFVVPTIGFVQLYVLVIVRLARRELVWINVTAHPTAEWIAQQLTEAFPWNEVPRYLIRDRDGIYGAAVTCRLRAMGIRDKPIAPGSPWQNGYVERLIGTIRRECLDHMIVFGEAHLQSDNWRWAGGTGQRGHARMLSALQVNLAGGRLPAPEDDGRCCLKFPLNAFPQASWGSLAPD